MNDSRSILSVWTLKMAWRDSRSSRRRLLLFSASIVLGVAALAAIGSFGKNLERAIEEQARTLLGADLVISSRQVFSPRVEALLQSIGGTQSREVSFSSMIYFAKNDGTRLVQVRALSGEFPFYGTLETEPAMAVEEFRGGNGALVEENLLLQYDAQVGDTIRLGELTTKIVGRLKKVPGETVAFATIAPRVYLPMTDLAKTRLLREGSLARYKVYFQLPAATNAAQIVTAIRPQLDESRLSVETVEDRKRSLGRAMENLDNFLNLVGFVALLLGAVGVASAIHVHIREKLDTVAVLRCLGATTAQTVAIYLVQGAAIGLIGAIVGGALGVLIQQAVPMALADFLPFQFTFVTSWSAVVQAMCMGFLICFLFALLPLLSVRQVSPLAAIRASFETMSRHRDPWVWVTYGLIALGIVWFSVAHATPWYRGFGFAGGLAVAFAILAGTARSIIWVVKRTVLPTWPYVLRQGLANLHRPNNRTLLLMLSLGLGTFLILTLFLVQNTLLTQLVSSRESHQPNAILFDIQSDQREAVAQLIRSQGLEVLDEAPIVTMRLSSIKGRTVESILADTNSGLPGWVLRREYRSTHHDKLRDAEKIIAGTFVPRFDLTNGVIPVSVEEGIAKELKVGLGDEIVFDIQGVPVATRVASLREVDWRRVQPNFFMVFPQGTIDDAPAFHVMVTRVESPEQSARLQRAVVQKFPNVSTIDLTLILQTLDSILSKISFAVRFMALFTVATGLVVLVGAILTGRYQRVRESILLRTLGASRKQVLRILLVEYAALGFLAALTGTVLSVAASWALSKFVFDVRFAPPMWPLAVSLTIMPVLTVWIGLLMSRGILGRPPLEILRADG